MRAILTIDEDALAATCHISEEELARQGLSRTVGEALPERNGVPLLASNPNAIPVTLEWVNQLRDDLP